MNIKALISLPEGKTLEFKRDVSSIKPIVKTIIAFANTAGGILFIGKITMEQLLELMTFLQPKKNLPMELQTMFIPH